MRIVVRVCYRLFYLIHTKLFHPLIKWFNLAVQNNLKQDFYYDRAKLIYFHVLTGDDKIKFEMAHLMAWRDDFANRVFL